MFETWIGYSRSMVALTAWPDVPSDGNSTEVNGQADQTYYVVNVHRKHCNTFLEAESTKFVPVFLSPFLVCSLKSVIQTDFNEFPNFILG